MPSLPPKRLSTPQKKTLRKTTPSLEKPISLSNGKSNTAKGGEGEKKIRRIWWVLARSNHSPMRTIRCRWDILKKLFISRSGILPWHTEGYLNRSHNLMVRDRIWWSDVFLNGLRERVVGIQWLLIIGEVGIDMRKRGGNRRGYLGLIFFRFVLKSSREL